MNDCIMENKKPRGKNTTGCIVLMCKNRGKIPGVTYFRLSKQRYDSWMEALGIDSKIQPYSTSNHVCSIHFLPEDLMLASQGKSNIKYGAIPRLHLGPNIEFRKNLLALAKGKISNELVPKVLTVNVNGISNPPEIKIETVDHDVKEDIIINEVHISEYTSSTTLSCQPSEDSLFDNNNLFLFLLLIKFCSLAILQNPYQYLADESTTIKPEPESEGSTFSSTDSEGFKGSIKRRRRYVKTVHTYCLSPEAIRQKQQHQREMRKNLSRKLSNVTRQMKRLQKRVESLKAENMRLRKMKKPISWPINL